jgi:hypothetical protein
MTATDSVTIASGPRLGRWLVWLCHLLIVTSALGLFSEIRSAAMINWRGSGDDFPFMIFFEVVLLPAFAISCHMIAGFALLFWRHPAGLHAAIIAIWIAPSLHLAQAILLSHQFHDASGLLGELLLSGLNGGFFNALACSAFILGSPRLRRAYGIALAEDSKSMVGALPPSMMRISWIGCFCIYLCLPSLASFAPLARQFGDMPIVLGSLILPRSVVTTAVAVPFLAVALLLTKYRRHHHVIYAIVLLWLAVPLPFAVAFVPLLAGPLSLWKHAAQLLQGLGFDLIAAYAWTAYLLTAPRVRELYPRPVEVVDVEAF